MAPLVSMQRGCKLIPVGTHQTCMDTDVPTSFNCLRAELNHIVSGGAIVSVASVAGLSGVANMAAYVASKHAVAGLTKTAAQEAGAMNVRINAVAP